MAIRMVLIGELEVQDCAAAHHMAALVLACFPAFRWWISQRQRKNGSNVRRKREAKATKGLATAGADSSSAGPPTPCPLSFPPHLASCFAAGKVFFTP